MKTGWGVLLGGPTDLGHLSASVETKPGTFFDRKRENTSGFGLGRIHTPLALSNPKTNPLEITPITAHADRSCYLHAARAERDVHAITALRRPLNRHQRTKTLRRHHLLSSPSNFFPSLPPLAGKTPSESVKILTPPHPHSR